MAVASCGKKKKKDESTTNADGSTKLTAVTSVAELGLSSALNISVPAAYSKAATSLSLTAAKKSQDACRIGEPISQVSDNINQVGNFFCHIEVEKAKIKFGTKYNVTAKGEAFAQIWIDNSLAADNKITMYMCEEGKLQQKIDISGIIMGADGKPTGVKGSVQNLGAEGTYTWASSVTFDKGFTAAALDVSSQDKYTDSATSGTFARAVKMTLYDSEDTVSKVSMSSSGTWGGQSFSQKAYGLGASKFGQTIFYDKGTYQGSTFEHTQRAYFNSAGEVVAADASALLAATGSLYVKATDLPEFLAANFTPDAPAGWDCSGTTETVDLDPESAEHNACSGKNQSSQSSCWDATYESGAAE